VSEEKELNDIGLNCETRPLPSVASALDRSRKWYFRDHCSCRMNSGSYSNPKDQAQALESVGTWPVATYLKNGSAAGALSAAREPRTACYCHREEGDRCLGV
jgi:hypothetical protein